MPPRGWALHPPDRFHRLRAAAEGKGSNVHALCLAFFEIEGKSRGARGDDIGGPLLHLTHLSPSRQSPSSRRHPGGFSPGLGLAKGASTGPFHSACARGPIGGRPAANPFPLSNVLSDAGANDMQAASLAGGIRARPFPALSEALSGLSGRIRLLRIVRVRAPLLWRYFRPSSAERNAGGVTARPSHRNGGSRDGCSR